MSEQKYLLKGGGWVLFNWDTDVYAAMPYFEDTFVRLRDGHSYLLEGRKYGV